MIKILSLNVFFVACCFGLYNISPNISDRSKLISSAILNLDDKPDIIVLQETFDYRIVRNNIYNKIKDIYPYFYIDDRCGRFWLGVNSGLSIFSRYPIKDKIIYDYKFKSGDSLLSRKGIMGIKVDVQGQIISIFNTHMQAGNKDTFIFRLLSSITKHNVDEIDMRKLNTKQIRHMQLLEAKSIIDKFGEGMIIYAGDFNINAYDNKTYKNPLNPDMEISAFNSISTVFPNSETYDPLVNGVTSSIYNDEKRIDYILELTDSNNIKSHITTKFTLEMTDHKGIIGVKT